MSRKQNNGRNLENTISEQTITEGEPLTDSKEQNPSARIKKLAMELAILVSEIDKQAGQKENTE